MTNPKSTAHIIYPFDLKKQINPWSIGNNLYFILRKKYYVKTYNWTSVQKIIPKNGDILIGHPHSNPFTIFRRSFMSNKWSKKIVIQPFNGDLEQMSHLYNVIDKCDEFIAICGSYWIKYLNKSVLKVWKNKITQVDLGLYKEKYPFIKKKFNKIGKRKFLFIGNDYSYNNFAKNLNYLKLISKKSQIKNFATIGNKKVGDIKHYGWLNLANKKSLKIISKYDFLIHTSKFDANPSTVLESMSWGLIPVITKECGYEGLNKNCYIPSKNVLTAIGKLKDLQNLDENVLKKIQLENLNLLEKKYNWKNFRKKIKKVLSKKRKNNILQYSKKKINIFESNKRKSNNYYLKYEILFSVIKSNIKILIQKISNLCTIF